MSDANCEHCGAEFEPAVYWQKFCSPNCRKRYHDKRSKLRAARRMLDDLLAEKLEER